MVQQKTPAQEQHGEQPDQPSQSTFWEWVVAACGLVLVLSTLGFLGWQALTQPATPPEVQVQAARIQALRQGYLVEIRVRNRGNSTAAALTIEGRLSAGSEDVETSSTSIDYLPARSERQGGLYFAHDPRQFTLQLGPKGYQKP